MTTTQYLSQAAEMSPAVTLGHGLPTEKNGQPVKYFWADAIRTGVYHNHAKRFTLAVDRPRMDNWVKTFALMKQQGVDVTVNADHSDKAANALGYVVDMRREGDTLKVLHALIGDDAIRMAARNKVSLGVDPDFVDGTGNRYGDAVVHSALTPVPVVPGQGGLIAASRGQDDQALVFELAASDKGDGDMPNLTKLREALGAAADVSDEQLIDQAAARLGTLKTENATLSRTVGERDQQIQTLSRTAPASPAKPSPSELYWANKAVNSAREEAIKNGGVSPATCDAAEKRWMPKPIDRATITLSRAVEDDDHKLTDGFARLLDFYEVVKDNKPTPPTGSVTGVQTLSRETPGAPEADAIAKAGEQQGQAYRDKLLAARGGTR